MFYHIIVAINILAENFCEFVDDESKLTRSRKGILRLFNFRNI